MPPPPTFLLAAILAGLPVVPGHAEENRLLPFWGQPFPSGYAWTEAVAPVPTLRCRPRLAGPDRGLPSRMRCAGVLHVRG